MSITGSLPGTDPLEAVRLVLGELPDLPVLPELPDRGVGAQMIGRGAALLDSMPVQIVPSGWRLAAHPGRDLRGARDLLAADLDALAEGAEGYRGPLKLALSGPWTLAACLELPSGHRVVSDHGAVRDLIQSLAQGLRSHIEAVHGAVPGARVIVQLDEPMLPAVLDARVPTPSGYGTVRAVEASVVTAGLSQVLEVVPAPNRVVHCCAAQVPFALLREAGTAAISFDAATMDLRSGATLDALGECVDAAVSLWWGLVPGTVTPLDRGLLMEKLLRTWSVLGFSKSRLAAAVVPVSACGLAGASPEYVRRALSVLREVGGELRELA